MATLMDTLINKQRSRFKVETRPSKNTLLKRSTGQIASKWKMVEFILKLEPCGVHALQQPSDTMASHLTTSHLTHLVGGAHKAKRLFQVGHGPVKRGEGPGGGGGGCGGGGDNNNSSGGYDGNDGDGRGVGRGLCQGLGWGVDAGDGYQLLW